MIIIFSIKNDFSTNEIIDYLIKKNEDFIRINEDDYFEIFKMDNEICIGNENIGKINIHDINAIWYRKSILQLKNKYLINDSLNYFKNEEIKIFNEYILFQLKTKINLGSYSTIKVNKLVVNEIAKKVGLLVPKSFFSDSKNVNCKIDLITKPINENSIVPYDINTYFKLLTKEVSNEDNLKYSLSYFQEKIDKKYELRIFYLDGETYSMAIFSQNNAKTNIDFRNYDTENPNRTVPYKLSNKMNEKIDNLMKLLGLNTGSIDILVDKNLNHYFLEVNPVGQFGMVSYPCNYNLEEKISNFLTNGK